MCPFWWLLSNKASFYHAEMKCIMRCFSLLFLGIRYLLHIIIQKSFGASYTHWYERKFKSNLRYLKHISYLYSVQECVWYYCKEAVITLKDSVRWFCFGDGSEFSSHVHKTDDFLKELKDMDIVTKELAFLIYSQQLRTQNYWKLMAK